MEHFFINIELITNLCTFLNYEQQFKLLQVSRQLRDIIVNYVWNRKFQKIQIVMYQSSFVVMYSTTQTINDDDSFDFYDKWRINSCLLTCKNLESFLYLNVNNIKKLQLIRHTKDLYAFESIKNALPFRQTFSNLTELSCWYIKFDNTDLQQLAENCAKLERLVLRKCFHLDGSPLRIEHDKDIQILKAMQNFNNLSIYDCNYTFSTINSFIDELKLQQLTLEGIMASNVSTTKEIKLNLNNLKHYKILALSSFCDSLDFIYFQTNILSHLENLCNLSLSTIIDISIAKEFFNVLLVSCKSLTHLHLEGFNIKDFIALPSLNELSLSQCKGLTYSHLKTILSEMDLKRFNSYNTKYTGDFECFPMSTSLQNIAMGLIDNNVRQLLEFNETNLINLTEFYYHQISTEEFTISKFANNLKFLIIRTEQFIAQDCLKLKYLQAINLYNTEISEFLLLLKHENLQKLTVHYIIYTAEEKYLVLKELKTFRTNLRYLTLIWYNKKSITDLLLDLLNINKKLSFECFIENAKSVIEILDHGKFPKRFKNINVCGVYIDRNYIQNHCVETMYQIQHLIETLKQNDYSWEAYFLLQ